MLIAGIVGYEGREQTAGLINSFLSSSEKKIRIVDLSTLSQLDTNRLNDYITILKAEFVDILIIKVGYEAEPVNLIKGLYFDVLIFTASKNDLLSQQEKNMLLQTSKMLIKKLKADGTVIINGDDGSNIDLSGIKGQTVTYGFGKNASVATSSIGDTISKNDVLFCLQKSVATNTGKVIEPQEYRVRCGQDDIDTNNVLAAASFAIINDVDLNAPLYFE